MENNIRHWRRKRSLSQQALGKLVGLGKPAISKLERGEMGLRDVTIAKLIAALDVTVVDLLGDYAGGGIEPGGEKQPVDTADSEETDFGFRRVAPGEKTPLVRAVFAGVAERYDLMNDVMSLGVHRLWKGAMIDRLKPRSGERIVDVAGGTGDIAFRILERRADVHIMVCDTAGEMVGIGRDRAIDRGMIPGAAGGIDWLCGDAEALPFADASMDAYTIAFGIRNVTCINDALAEARRVLKPGGRFLCLEFGRVALPALARMYDAYSFKILPEIGAMIAGNRDAYRYLVESIRRFPDQRRFAAMITTQGLGQCRYDNLSGGIAALHSAWRI